METKNGYKDFNYGDIIIFKDKKYKFIEINGEDYMLKGIGKTADIYLRAYYNYDFIKVKEEIKTVTTWEWKMN
jgi:hypothetical protein